MHKLCPRCGIIFQVTEQEKFCSDKCEKLFQQSGLDMINGRPSSLSSYTCKEGMMSTLASGVKTGSSTIQTTKPTGEFRHSDDGNTEIIRPVRK